MVDYNTESLRLLAEEDKLKKKYVFPMKIYLSLWCFLSGLDEVFSSR